MTQQPLAGRLQPLEMNNPPKVNPCLALRTEQTKTVVARLLRATRGCGQEKLPLAGSLEMSVQVGNP